MRKLAADELERLRANQMSEDEKRTLLKSVNCSEWHNSGIFQRGLPP